MLFNAKMTAAFATLYSLIATIGIASVIVGHRGHMGRSGLTGFQPRMPIPAGLGTQYTIALGLVMGIAAVLVLVTCTPDYWSYWRAGLTLWLGMTLAAPCLAYTFDIAPSLNLFFVNAVASGLSLLAPIAMLKRRRLADAIRVRLAARDAQVGVRNVAWTMHALKRGKALVDQGNS